MQNFRRLAVWRKAHQLVLEIYQTSRDFPKVEQYGLTIQLRRAAVSIACNIVEGSARRNDRDMSRFLLYALGSAAEVEYQLLLCHDLKYLTGDKHTTLAALTIEVEKMLNSFVSKLRTAGNQRLTTNG